MTASDAKGTIFVFEEEGAREFVDSVLRAADNTVIVCSSDAIRNALSGYACRNLDSYSDDASADLQKATNWMKMWPDVSILKGKSLKELLVYGGVSIYWYLQTRFYLHRLRDLLILIERLKRVLEIERPEKIWIKGSEDAKYIISKLYGHDKIAGFERLGPEQHRTKVSYKSYRGHPTLKLLLLKLLRGTFFAPIGEGPRKANRRILVVTEVSNWRREYDYQLRRYETRDVFFHDTVKKLVGLGYDVIVVDFENRPSELLRARTTNRLRHQSFGVPVRPWEKYVSLRTILKSRTVSRNIAKLWKELQHSDEFAKSLVYEDVPMYELIREDIADLFKSLKAHAAITFIEAAKKITEVERPSVVVMHDEYGALQLSLISASRVRGIPTLSLQHGLISEEQISYVHDSEHISGKKSQLLFPIPDRMCVWSEFSGQKLIDIAKFPPSVPVVTGDPKSDFLPQAMKGFNRSEILQRHGIPEVGKIVLFATENLPSQEEKSLVIKSVFSAVKDLSGCHLIIKMHPIETDIPLYERSAAESGLKNFSILTDANLYELLYASDVVVLSYSTVAAEAMRMGRPVISLNLMGLHDNVTFVRNGMALVVNRAGDLLPMIQKCLEKTPPIHEIVVKAKGFADEHLGVADGMASDRIVRVIAELCRNYEKNATQGDGNSGG